MVPSFMDFKVTKLYISIRYKALVPSCIDFRAIQIWRVTFARASSFIDLKIIGIAKPYKSVRLGAMAWLAAAIVSQRAPIAPVIRSTLPTSHGVSV
jgi:hypothetical protein